MKNRKMSLLLVGLLLMSLLVVGCGNQEEEMEDPEEVEEQLDPEDLPEDIEEEVEDLEEDLEPEIPEEPEDMDLDDQGE